MDEIEAESAHSEGVAGASDAPSARPSAHLKMKIEMMERILQFAQDARWNQSEAARQCHVHQPRMNDLFRRKIENFSLDALVKLAISLGFSVRLEIEDP